MLVSLVYSSVEFVDTIYTTSTSEDKNHTMLRGILTLLASNYLEANYIVN